jgi:hypothetical protein
MNGFDQFASSETGAAGAERLKPSFPDDFTQDEALFASELRTVFDIEREDLPSGYVPTVLGFERHKPAMPGFERRVTRQVFHELNLPGLPLFDRRPVQQIRAIFAEQADQLQRVGRSAAGVLTAVLIVMVLSMLFATPSFADGMQILLGHTGVQQVAAYPRNVGKPAPQPVEPQEVQTPLYWMGPAVGDYTYLGMRKVPNEGWSTGPIVDVQYVLTHVSKGSGILDVRMFQVADKYAAVLKVVQDGSAHETTVGGAKAAFVSGAWQTYGRNKTWRFDARNEVIFERDGMVFWIASDPRDGLTEAQIIAAASQMRPATRRDLSTKLSVGSVGHELQSLLRSPSGEDLYALVLRGDSAAGAHDLVRFQSAAPTHQYEMN